MALIKALGIDITLFYQLAIYLTAYFILYYLVFKPYALASLERYKRTKAKVEELDQLKKEVEELQKKFSKKATSLNSEVKTIFEKQQIELAEKKQEILNATKIKNDEKKQETRKALAQQEKQFNENISSVVDDISNNITEKVLQG